MPSPVATDHPADETRPLASYVLRVRGRPASLCFELLDVRSGERHLFRKSASVVAFLQRNGLRPDDAATNDPPA
jgi:hypothetical protein